MIYMTYLYIKVATFKVLLATSFDFQQPFEFKKNNFL